MGQTSSRMIQAATRRPPPSSVKVDDEVDDEAEVGVEVEDVRARLRMRMRRM